MGGAYSPHWEMRSANKTFVGKPEGKRPDEWPRRRILGKYGWKVWTGFIWLTIGWSDGLVWPRYLTFEFHYGRGISWLAQVTDTFSIKALLHGVSISFLRSLDVCQYEAVVVLHPHLFGGLKKSTRNLILNALDITLYLASDTDHVWVTSQF
jgi:hypothetical protein